jgi:4-amino-4-deoxy-L-arabinose transferase-like glycosyltransferase
VKQPPAIPTGSGVPRAATGLHVPFAGVLALLVVLAFAFQGSRGLWEPDEGRYTAAGVNMIESGDWLVPTVDREHPHLTKPPLTYWALAASFGALGHNEWAARLPGALAFVGTGLLVWGLGRRFVPGAPWLPAVVWALSPGPFVAANIVSTDALLVLFETLAMYAFVEAWTRGGGAARPWYLLMWLGWGLAFMTKGPPGLLPLLAVVAFLAVHDRSRLRELFPWGGLALFALVGLTWYAVIVLHAPDRLQYFLQHEVYDRVFTGTHRRNPQWYGGFEVYGPVLLLGALPWSVAALVAARGPSSVRRALRGRLRGDRSWQLVAYWFLVPLGVFFLARSRLALYVLPLFVPLSLALARPLVRLVAGRGRGLLVTATVTAGALVAAKGLLAYASVDRDARQIASHVAELTGDRGIVGVVFVDMNPYFGLTMYLDVAVEGIHRDPQRIRHSRPVDEETLCDELAEGRHAFAVKRRHAASLESDAADCGYVLQRVGSLHADDNDVDLYLVPDDYR